MEFGRGDLKFHYRVSGVALHEGRVLLHRAVTDPFWILPGGHGEFLEDAASTLRREMREEVGQEVTVGRLIWVVENFFRYAGYRCHELGLFFQMDLAPGSPLLGHPGPFHGHEGKLPLIFQWYDVTDLTGVTLYPAFLKEALTAVPAGTEHVVNREIPPLVPGA